VSSSHKWAHEQSTREEFEFERESASAKLLKEKSSCWEKHEISRSNLRAIENVGRSRDEVER